MTTRRTAGAAAIGAGVAIWLAACAPPYQPVGLMGGFNELPLGEDTFLVAFHWTRFTSQDRIMDFLLLRAAEVALDRGAPYFIVLEQSAELQTDLLRGTLAIRPAARPSAEREAARGPEDARLNEDLRTLGIRIRLVKEKPPSDSRILDAAKVRADLRARYGLGT
jgi:hypothetical protein